MASYQVGTLLESQVARWFGLKDYPAQSLFFCHAAPVPAPAPGPGYSALTPNQLLQQQPSAQQVHCYCTSSFFHPCRKSLAYRWICWYSTSFHAKRVGFQALLTLATSPSVCFVWYGNCLQASSNPQLSAASPSVLNNPGIAALQTTTSPGN